MHLSEMNPLRIYAKTFKSFYLFIEGKAKCYKSKLREK